MGAASTLCLLSSFRVSPDRRHIEGSGPSASPKLSKVDASAAALRMPDVVDTK
jgi:hypothetical protein